MSKFFEAYLRCVKDVINPEVLAIMAALVSIVASVCGLVALILWAIQYA